VDVVYEYVAHRWREFFRTEIPRENHVRLVALILKFQGETDQSLEAGFGFIRDHAELLAYEKKQVGQGEFALYLLFPGATRIEDKHKKGDIKLFDVVYEVKKIKLEREAIRFGTNMELMTISDFRLVTLGLKRIFYSDGDVIFNDLRESYRQILGGSESSVVIPKMEKLYTLFNKILAHSSSDEYYNLHVVWLLDYFIKRYPSVSEYGVAVVDEVKQVYKSLGIKILIIDNENVFRVDPDFKYHSINQYIRPQVILKKQ